MSYRPKIGFQTYMHDCTKNRYDHGMPKTLQNLYHVWFYMPVRMTLQVSSMTNEQLCRRQSITHRLDCGEHPYRRDVWLIQVLISLVD